MLCHAKSLGIRIIVPATPPTAVYAGNNETAKAAWADATAAGVKTLFADGINMDTEDAIAPNDTATRVSTPVN